MNYPFCEAMSLGAEVIYHEYTHLLGFGEALADYFGATLTNDPDLAECLIYPVYPGPCVPLRTFRNTLRYPQDLVNERHYDGQILNAALWELRGMIGQALTDELVVRTMKLGDADSYFEGFLTHLLMIDDDNANLADGTPHSAQICQAFFTNHGLPDTLGVCAPAGPYQVRILSPQNGDVVSGVVTISVEVTNIAIPVGAVYAYLSRSPSTLGPDASAPYTFSWDTRVSPDGSVDLRASALDWFGRSEALSPVIQVRVANYTPVIAPIGNKTVAEGQLLEFRVRAEDESGNLLGPIRATGLPDLPPENCTGWW